MGREKQTHVSLSLSTAEPHAHSSNEVNTGTVNPPGSAEDEHHANLLNPCFYQGYLSVLADVKSQAIWSTSDEQSQL